MVAITWETLDHLSVLVAAVVALPTVACAALAAYFAKRTVTEERFGRQQRQVGDLIACVARMRRFLSDENQLLLHDADEQADVIASLLLSLPEPLPRTAELAKSDPLRADPRKLIELADASLEELRAALVIVNPDADASGSARARKFLSG
jgi:hypothetical protein